MRLVLLFAITLLFISCSKQESIKDYYFDLEDYSEAKVYVFQDDKGQAETYYWKVYSDLEDNLLITEAYSQDFEIVEYFVERYNEDGSELVDYKTFMNGEAVDAEVIHKDVFQWIPNGEFRYGMNFFDESGKTKFVKTRSYLGKEMTEYKGQKVEAVKFRGDYRFENDQYEEPLEYWQYTYYTKDKAIIKYERFFDDGTTYIQEVSRILTAAEWAELSGQ